MSEKEKVMIEKISKLPPELQTNLQTSSTAPQWRWTCWKRGQPMPKTRFDKIARDPLKELVLGRKAAVRISEVNLAKKMGISTGRLRTMFSGPSDSWKIGEVKALSRALDMPIDEFRTLIAR